MKKVLFVLGLSGSGKSFITTELINNYPETFYKLEQYTTRPRRSETENEYFYITKEHYKIVEDKLMSNTIVNGNWYGTIPTLNDTGIAIVIVNALGLKNGVQYVKKNNISYEIMYVKSEVPFEIRKNRNCDQEETNIDTILSVLDIVPYNPYCIIIDSIATFLEKIAVPKQRYLEILNDAGHILPIDGTLVKHITNLFQ